MKLTEEDFDAIINALDLLYRPAEYGCRFDFGDPATQHERVGRIIENLSATAAAMLFSAGKGTHPRPPRNSTMH